MATLTISSNSLSSAISISDERFQEYARLLVEQAQAEGIDVGTTNQEKLDWLVREVGRMVRARVMGIRGGELTSDTQTILDAEFTEAWG